MKKRAGNTYLAQVQRGVDAVEAQLESTIELRVVSKAAGMSHAHFQRTFKAITGETLAGYIRQRRMAHALDLLLKTERRVLDVAVAAGFESQEAFARAFKRTFGTTPSECRTLGNRHRYLRKVRVDERYLTHLSTTKREPELQRRGAMQLVGVRTQFYGRESEKNNLGEVLPQLWQAYLPRANETECVVPGDFYGVVAQDEDDAERLVYHACREVKCTAPLPSGFVRTR